MSNIHLFDEARRRVASGQDLPPRLAEISDRHKTQLMALVDSLRDAGFAEDDINDGVSTLVASYEAELKEAMKAMVDVR